MPLFFLVLSFADEIPLRRKIHILMASLAALFLGGPVTAFLLFLLLLLWGSGNLSLEKEENVLLIASFIALGLCEFVHLDNLYGDELRRMNTVFKFYILAWWGLAIAVPLLLWRHRNSFFRYRKLGWGCLMLSIGASLVYPLFATASRTGPLLRKGTLDGMTYFRHILPGEREAIEWLRDNALSSDVVWEAPGPAYSLYGRISSFSGRPTLLGWANHEWVWRREGHKLTSARQADMDALKKEPSLSALREFIRKYKVHFIIIGAMERTDYPKALREVIAQYPLVFSTSTTQIYESNGRI